MVRLSAKEQSTIDVGMRLLPEFLPTCLGYVVLCFIH